jgi:phospholipase C
LPGPEAWNREVVPPSDAEASAARTACSYGRGALPAETQGASYPMGSDIPIDHVFVVMMENRSFDHYFQKLPEYGQPEADVAPAGFSNRDSDGNEVPIFQQQAYCFVDTDHGWNAVHEQIASGQIDRMGGFVTSNEGSHEMPAMGNLEMFSGRRAMGYYDASDIPFYYWLANEFALGDRYFSSLPGPTFPNRMYLLGASSYGLVRNSLPGDYDIIVDYLEEREVDWKVYASGSASIGMYISKVKYLADHVVRIDQFFEDAKSGNLPQFAFIDPKVGLATGEWDNNDEHPPALAQIGQHFVATLVEALTKSPAWPRSAMFLSYDEHGGLYDHVEPPSACPPDDLAPQLEAGDVDAAFDQLGPRVPFIVVSPYAKKHYVSHEIYDHTSITRFIGARFTVPAITARDANALAPFDMFDFDHPPHLDPPAIQLPNIPTSQDAVCSEIFETGG